MRYLELFTWMKERHFIYEARKEGLPKPWTKDPILRAWRFCNVYRELDKVTIWIAENIREPYADHRHLWWGLCLARRINYLDTLAEIVVDRKGAWPLSRQSQYHYDPARLMAILDARKARGEQVETGAYMITAEHVPGRPKSHTTAHATLGALWDAKEDISARIEAARSCSTAYHAIHGRGFAIGDFIAAQVIADLKFAYEGSWEDFWTFVVMGPGSARGMNRLFGNPPKESWGVDGAWYDNLAKLQAKIDPLVAKAVMPRVSAQDLQNCLCEFDKYERVRVDGKRPRSRYDGG